MLSLRLTQRTHVPLVRETQGHDDENDVEPKHEHAHALGHLPVEDEDAEEDAQEHEEEEGDGAADTGGADGDAVAVHGAVQQPGERKTRRRKQQD